MFNPTHIRQLKEGNLSMEGYRHLLKGIAGAARKANWPKSLIVSARPGNSYWTNEEVEELAQAFFEWVLGKEKLNHIGNTPDAYLPYYFSYILVSFVGDKTKEIQAKQGVSYAKVRELVKEVLKEQYQSTTHQHREHWFKMGVLKEIKPPQEVDEVCGLLPKTPIPPDARHYKPFVRATVRDIFDMVDAPLPEEKLTQLTFSLLDQSAFGLSVTEEVNTITFTDNSKAPLHEKAVQALVQQVSAGDALLIRTYLFGDSNEQSLAAVAAVFNIPKSTAHHKIESFRKKIFSTYLPENEEDGISFLKRLAAALDKF